MTGVAADPGHPIRSAPLWRRSRFGWGNIPALLGFASFIGLYIRLVDIGRYHVTVGGGLVGIVILFSLRRTHFSLYPLLFALLALVWPLVIFGASTFLNVGIQALPEQFVASYSLWAISVVTIALSFCTRSPVSARYAFNANLIIIAICLIQVLGAAVLHSAIGYQIVQPLTGVDVSRGYVGVAMDFGARAIGLVYEPSMCGRLIGTLCFIDVLISRKLRRNVVLAILGLLLTKSLGLLILIVAAGAILFARSPRHFAMLGIGFALFVAVQGSMISSRMLSFDGNGGASSTYLRTIAPIDAVSYSVEHYPLGVTIGSNELLSEVTGYISLTGERITNGVYEFILYFGVFGIATILMILSYLVIYFIWGERERSAALAYLLLSTALSGSFLSIESSLLTYFFIASCLSARAQRLKDERGNASRASRAPFLSGFGPTSRVSRLGG